ncbi:MAG: ATP synthase F0 subunit B [Deltaproteobacteria bacterium]|nr:ATP synthase F0 subunit B [Deltaproteobacteria bacterium]
MVELNSTLVIQMINFFILIFLLNFLLYKPILHIIQKRNNMLDKSREETLSLHEAVDKKISEYDEKLSRARVEAMHHRDQIRAEGVEAATEIIEQAKSEISTMVEEFKIKLEKEREEASIILRERTKDIAVEISEKILGRGIQ